MTQTPITAAEQPKMSTTETVLGAVRELGRAGYRCDRHSIQELTKLPMTVVDDPHERAKQLATNAAEAFIRCNGISTDTPNKFIFHGADIADEYFQDCIAHLKWEGQCVVFEHEDETVVLLGDYTLESLA